MIKFIAVAALFSMSAHAEKFVNLDAATSATLYDALKQTPSVTRGFPPVSTKGLDGLTCKRAGRVIGPAPVAPRTSCTLDIELESAEIKEIYAILDLKESMRPGPSGLATHVKVVSGNLSFIAATRMGGRPGSTGIVYKLSYTGAGAEVPSEEEVGEDKVRVEGEAAKEIYSKLDVQPVERRVMMPNAPRIRYKSAGSLICAEHSKRFPPMPPTYSCTLTGKSL